MRIGKSVHLIQVTFAFGRRGVNLYLVEGEMPILIDSGYSDGGSLRQVEHGIQISGYSLKDIAVLINTHAHMDHSGGNAALQGISGAEMAAHPLEADVVLNPRDAWETAFRDTEDLVNKSGVPLNMRRDILRTQIESQPRESNVKVNRLLNDGDRISTGGSELRVIHTPGHSPGHICLYLEDQGILFSGDHVLPRTTPNIGNLRHFVDSLKKLLAYEINIIAPGHEPLITSRPKDRILELIEHHNRRMAAFRNLIQFNSGSTMYQLATSYWGHLTPRHLVLALREGYAHVEKLIEDGEVAVDERMGIQHYRLKQYT